MRWLLHGQMTGAVADALSKRGDEIQTVHLPAQAAAQDVLKAAATNQLDVISTDGKLATAPFELDWVFPRSIVYLQLQGADIEQDDAIRRLFERYRRLAPGRLYTVTATRVKVRQLPGKR